MLLGCVSILALVSRGSQEQSKMTRTPPFMLSGCLPTQPVMELNHAKAYQLDTRSRAAIGPYLSL